MIDTLKECCTCRQLKPRDAFSKRASEKDGLQPRCKDCAAGYYQANRSEIYEKIKARKARIVEESRQFIWNYLSKHPCVDCGEADPIVLDFDHVRGVKANHVTKIVLRGDGLKAVIREIEKCDVRCANCHRRKTAVSLGWYRNILAARARQDGHRTFNPD